MKRLVYSPKVTAYVKTDYGIIDVSEYVTAGGVQRKLDQVSSATLTLRNPNKKWTDYEYHDPITKKSMVGPVFHPMDPISIVMTRLQNRPIHVFTGFLDQTPYLQLFPGTVTLNASCTLKKLLYTYFDPGLPFFNEFLGQYGWETREDVGIVHPSSEKRQASGTGKLTDSGFGELLYAIVHVIGGWPDESIYIENLPHKLIDLVTEIFKDFSKEPKESNEQFTQLLHEVVGSSSSGSSSFGGSTNETPASSVTGTVSGTNMTPAHAAFVSQLAGLIGLSLRVIGAWVAYENGPPDNPLNIGPGNSYGTVQAGVKATSDLLHESYKDILSTAGKPDQQQCEAIADSSWCPGCPGYLAALLSLLSNIQVHS